jgi:hypothetical protein
MKTLIILDTNKVRSTILGGVAYGSFEFGSEFSSLSSYIKSKGLSEFIKIAIPSVAIQELLQQKVDQYDDDIQAISEIRIRLSGLPGVDFSQLSLPATGFDCKEHLRPRMEGFVQNNELTLINIEEEKFGQILKDVLKRAIEKRPPFRKGRNSTDIGFKDVMIWESILHYGNYDDYDKIILFTGDADFDQKCKAEFELKVNKELAITPSIELLQTKIEGDYTALIQSKKWRDFVETEYFKDYFQGEISKLEYVTINGIENKVIRTTVVKYLDRVEEPGSNEGTDLALVLVGLLKGTVEMDGGKNQKEVNITARTYLDDANELQYTEFGVES